MTIEQQLQRQSLQQGIDLVWRKLSNIAEDMGDNVHFWEWTPGVGMFGIIKAYEATGEQRYSSFIENWAIENAEKIKFGSVNWVIPANVLQSSYLLTGEDNYLEACRKMAHWCLHEALRTSNGGYAHVWGEGAGGLEDYRNQLWIDTLFMAGIFMLRFGKFDNNANLIEEALNQFNIHIESQFDRSCNLFYHGYHCLDQTTLGEHWGRGNGWAVVSLIELLDLLQDTSYDTSTYAEVFKAQMQSVYKLRMDNGMLRTLLKLESSYLETSASALFAYAAVKGYRLGLLDESYLSWGEQITDHILSNHLGEDGTVLHASGGTDCQELEGYLKVPYQSRQYNAGIVLMLLTEVNFVKGWG